MYRLKCPTCADCGEIANTIEGEPWSEWAALDEVPLAIIYGFIQPIRCPTCKEARAIEESTIDRLNGIQEFKR